MREIHPTDSPTVNAMSPIRIAERQVLSSRAVVMVVIVAAPVDFLLSVPLPPKPRISCLNVNAVAVKRPP